MSLRRLAKNAVFDACRYFGVNSISRTFLRGKMLILCYHGVIREHQPDAFGYGNTVSAAEFATQLDFLARSFHPVTTAEAIQWHNGSLTFRDTPALITFDDGYRNNLTVAAEVLRAKGIPAVFHVSTDYIENNRILWTEEVVYRVLRWPLALFPMPDGSQESLPAERQARRSMALRVKNLCKRIASEQSAAYLEQLRAVPAEMPDNDELFAFMNWDEVRALHRQGFEIGAHTMTHPILTRVDARRLADELTGSKLRIEQELGTACTSVAYPNGGSEDVSPAVLQAARDAGYRIGFTVSERHSEKSEDILGLSRITVWGHLPISLFEWRASGVETLYRSAS